MSPVVRTFKCKCGEFVVKLKNEPAACFNCHCHGCVAAMRYIDEKHGGSGTSAEVSHGCGKALYNAADIEFVGEDPASKLNFVKVGEKGAMVRSYTKCCGTQVNTALPPPPLRPFNRNCIYNEDGSKYEPEGVVMNLHVKHAFDPSIVPDPKTDSAPMSLIGTFIGAMAKGAFGMGWGKLAKEKAIRIDPKEVTEFVPITWE